MEKKICFALLLFHEVKVREREREGKQEVTHE